MPDFQTVCLHILKQKDNRKKILIGGLIAFIPILNFILIGYLLEFAKRLQSTNDLNLPSWDNLSERLLDTLRGIVVLIPYFFIPFLLGLTLTNTLQMVFSSLRLDLFSQTLAYFPVFSLSALALPLSTAALWQYLKSDDIKSLLEFEEIFALLKGCYKYLIMPLLCVFGLMFVGWPLYGITFFLGILSFVAYSFVVFINQEK